jgi:outer membrane biosynthesis protein TonB
MKNNRINRRLEGDLRASRSQPRTDFARALADEVRTRGAPERSPQGNVGLALALLGLIVVAIASFGGIGYASSAGSHTVKKQVAPTHVWIVEKPKTAAEAQYGPETVTTPTPPPKPPTPCPPECPAVPITTTTTPQTTPSTPPATNPVTPPTKPKPTVKTKAKATGQGAGAAEEQQNVAPKATSSQLPFTGLALWVPLAIGLTLIAFGLVLRTRGRRRHSEAH